MNFEFRISNKFNKSGFTLIEAMVLLFIFSIVVLTFYKTFTSGIKAIQNVKFRLAAISLANERMEIVHNLNYESIGTQGGVPSGDILQLQTINKSGKDYYVHTFIKYVDEPFDGTATAGTDVRPNDAKQVRIEVFWEDDNPAKSIALISNFSPPGIESIYTGGILSINVLDSGASGEVKPISQADVSIVNPSVGINMQTKTDATGNVFIPGLPPADDSYEITVSKDGYLDFETFAPYPSSAFVPSAEYIHANLVSGAINQKTITTDKLSQVDILTKDPLGNTVSNIDFALKGGKVLGQTNAEPAEDVYLYSNNSLNSGDGELHLNDMSFGRYFFTFNETSSNNTNYEFIHMSPSLEAKNKFNVVADSNIEETAVVVDKRVDSLLVTVVDSVDSLPISQASVELKSDTLGYGPITLQTDEYGQVYFPDASGPLEKQQYELSVSKTGFASDNSNVDIDGLTKKTISLSQL